MNPTEAGKPQNCCIMTRIVVFAHRYSRKMERRKMDTNLVVLFLGICRVQEWKRMKGIVKRVVMGELEDLIYSTPQFEG